MSFVNVPDIRGSQVSQPSGQMYLYNYCSSERLSHDKQELQKIFSLLHLGGILGENLWYLLTAFPLVSKYQSARHHSCGTIAFFQACWRRTVSFLRTRGQFLYNVYDISFKPRALPARALWTKSRTSFSFIPLSSNITVGSWGFGKSLRGGIGIPFKSSEYIIFKWFSSSSFHSLIPQKVFLRKRKDLNRMLSEPAAFSFGVFFWFSALEITKILFWISFRIFWSSGLSWIRASFNRRFSILCSDLSFPFCICRLYGRFPSVLSFLSVTAPNHSRQTSYITLQKDVNWWSMGPLRRVVSKKESSWSN